MLDLAPHPRLVAVLGPLPLIDVVFIAIAPMGAVASRRGALMNDSCLPYIALVAPDPRFLASATFAAVTTAVWMILVLLSTPTCAFIPKYHCLPFLVWCISGSRLSSRFFVEEGA